MRTSTGRSSYQKRKRLMSDMNVVPYIDVMLVLLIIFMVTAPLITQGVKVELPQVASDSVQSDKQPAIVSIDADGDYFLDYGDDKERPVNSEELSEKVGDLIEKEPSLQVLVNGHKDVAYARVVELMALLKKSGVPGVGLMTQPPEQP